MNKVLNIGKVKCGNINRNVFISVKIIDGRLSISGVIGPFSSGNAAGGCGQIDMEFKHRFAKNDDKRTRHLITPDEIIFEKEWNAEKWFDLLDVWEKWHLNDMRSGCEHQRAFGWTYEEHHDKKTFKGEACPVCGYEIGSSWLKDELPQSVIEFLESLPETKRDYAWV
jgi:hypothetical protein